MPSRGVCGGRGAPNLGEVRVEAKGAGGAVTSVLLVYVVADFYWARHKRGARAPALACAFRGGRWGPT
jgi:hypothetical protein